jgi:hypothetical protein
MAEEDLAGLVEGVPVAEEPAAITEISEKIEHGNTA